MGPASLRSELGCLIAAAAQQLWPGSIPSDFRFEVSESDNTDFGDLSCQAALRLARILRDSPRRIAETLVEHLGDGLPGVSELSVDGIPLENHKEIIRRLHNAVSCNG